MPRQKLRIRLWKEDPHCRFCKVLTILPESLPAEIKNGRRNIKSVPDNMATIDHLESRLNPVRRKLRGMLSVTLSCNKCNFERNREEELSLPLEELHRRSKRFSLAG